MKYTTGHLHVGYQKIDTYSGVINYIIMYTNFTENVITTVNSVITDSRLDYLPTFLNLLKR